MTTSTHGTVNICSQLSHIMSLKLLLNFCVEDDLNVPYRIVQKKLHKVLHV